MTTTGRFQLESVTRAEQLAAAFNSDVSTNSVRALSAAS